MTKLNMKLNATLKTENENMSFDADLNEFTGPLAATLLRHWAFLIETEINQRSRSKEKTS